MSNIDKYETRKKMVYDFMCDDMYVPMKIKELCIVLGVKKEDRPQLEQILLDLQAEGDNTLKAREILKVGNQKDSRRIHSASKGIWICHCGGRA